MTSPMLGAYVTSKFALEGLTETLRMELAPWDIKVVLVGPGPVKTSIWEKARSQADELDAAFPPEVTEQYAAHIAGIRRMIRRQELFALRPKKVAKVIQKGLFTPRPRSRYPVGMDAKGAGVMTRVLPDRARMAVVDRALRTNLYKA